MRAAKLLRQELAKKLDEADRIKSAIELLEGNAASQTKRTTRNRAGAKTNGSVSKATKAKIRTETLGSGDGRKLGAAQQKVLDFVSKNPNARAGDITKGTGQAANQVYSILSKLSQRGIIIIHGKGRGKTYTAA